MMTHPDLVGMVPEKEDSYSGIPYDKLFRKADDGTLQARAYEMCKGRVVFSADSNFPVEQLLPERPPQLTVSEWEMLTHSLAVDRIYVEYEVRDEM